MKKVPVILITGFLGSGKTTFINWILQNTSDIKTSVILNEFGDISLESEFIKKNDENIVELKNGCMCCVAKDDVPRIVRFILNKAPQTEYLIVEASGLSDPTPVKDSFKDDLVKDLVYLQSVICIVDVVNYFKYVDENPLILSQLGDSDLVLLNKIESVEESEYLKVKDAITSLADDIKVLSFTEDMPVDFFLNNDNQSIDDKQGEPKCTIGHHHDQYDSLILQSNKPILEKDIKIFLRQLPNSVIRCKGFVDTGEDNQKILIQYVGGRINIQNTKWKPDETPNSYLLILGKQLDANAISSIWDKLN